MKKKTKNIVFLLVIFALMTLCVSCAAPEKTTSEMSSPIVAATPTETPIPVEEEVVEVIEEVTSIPELTATPTLEPEGPTSIRYWYLKPSPNYSYLGRVEPKEGEDLTSEAKTWGEVAKVLNPERSPEGVKLQVGGCKEAHMLFDSSGTCFSPYLYWPTEERVLGNYYLVLAVNKQLVFNKETGIWVSTEEGVRYDLFLAYSGTLGIKEPFRAKDLDSLAILRNSIPTELTRFENRTVWWEMAYPISEAEAKAIAERFYVPMPMPIE